MVGRHRVRQIGFPTPAHGPDQGGDLIGVPVQELPPGDDDPRIGVVADVADGKDPRLGSGMTGRDGLGRDEALLGEIRIVQKRSEVVAVWHCLDLAKPEALLQQAVPRRTGLDRQGPALKHVGDGLQAPLGVGHDALGKALIEGEHGHHVDAPFTRYQQTVAAGNAECRLAAGHELHHRNAGAAGPDVQVEAGFLESTQLPRRVIAPELGFRHPVQLQGQTRV